MKIQHVMDKEFPIRELPKKEFPPQLLEIPQPPEKLYIRGELPGPSVAGVIQIMVKRPVKNLSPACAVMMWRLFLAWRLALMGLRTKQQSILALKLLPSSDQDWT